MGTRGLGSKKPIIHFCACHGAAGSAKMRAFHATQTPRTMAICHDQNLSQPLPEKRPYGIRVRLRGSDPFRSLVGGDWQKEHWFATARERDATLAQMSGRYVYFRPGDQPALDFERIDP
jgi:hypothetical protein